MANPSVTYTFSNGTTADATQVNQNFSDLINGLTDGTKDLTVAAITAAGAVSFQGHVTLGNGTPDDITVSGSLASSIPIKTNNSFDIGSATLGLASIYLGAPSSRTTRVRSNQSIASSFTLVLPVSVGSAGNKILGDGAGNLSFGNDGPAQADNYGLTATVGSNQLTVALKNAAGSDASTSSPVYVSSRSGTATTGTPVAQTITSAMSIVVPSSATLGTASAVAQYVHVYLIFGTSTEIAVAGSRIFDEGTLQNATAVSAGSTSATVLYATSNHTGKPIRYIGRIKSTQATAGTWATAPSEISLLVTPEVSPRSEIYYEDYVGYGSTNTKVPYFNTQQLLRGTALTQQSNDATSGLAILVNEDGVYTVDFGIGTGSGAGMAITVDCSAMTTNASSLTYAQGKRAYGENTAVTTVSWTGFLRVGQVIRPQTDGAGAGVDANRQFFSVCQVSRQ